MTRLKIKERIEQEEKKRITPLFLVVVIILIISVILNIILKVSLIIKIISGLTLFILVVLVGIAWYRAYYK